MKFFYPSTKYQNHVQCHSLPVVILTYQKLLEDAIAFLRAKIDIWHLCFSLNFQQRSDEKVLGHDPNSIKVVVRKQCKADAALGISIQGEGGCWRGSNQVLQTNWQDLKCHKCWKFFFVKPWLPCRGWKLKSVWIESIILHLVTRFQLIWVQLLIFHTNLWSVSGKKGEQPKLLNSGKYEAVCT